MKVVVGPKMLKIQFCRRYFQKKKKKKLSESLFFKVKLGYNEIMGTNEFTLLVFHFKE